MRYLLAWVPMAFIAVANGALRETWALPRQVSTMLLIVLLAVYMTFVFRRWPPRSARHAAAIGAVWLALTLVFEFGLGWLTGSSWSQMLAEYNLAAGRLWLLVPLWMAIAPYVYYRIEWLLRRGE